MLYTKHITYPSGQTANTATTTRFKVNRGIIFRVWVQFPAGSIGLTKVKISLEGHPICPVHKHEYLTANDYTFEIPLMHPIRAEPQQLVIEGWNEDDTYDHKILFVFLILPKKYVLPVGALEGVMASLSNLIIRKYEEPEVEELT